MTDSKVFFKTVICNRLCLYKQTIMNLHTQLDNRKSHTETKCIHTFTKSENAFEIKIQHFFQEDFKDSFSCF